MSKIALEVTFGVITCACCGMSFGVPDRFIEKRRRDHESFFCPSGCSNYFPGKSDEEKLREEVRRAKKTASFFEAEAEREKRSREAEQRSHRATRGHLTRTKQRVQGGVCPCCDKTFAVLAKHMKAAHPDYATTE